MLILLYHACLLNCPTTILSQTSVQWMRKSHLSTGRVLIYLPLTLVLGNIVIFSTERYYSKGSLQEEIQVKESHKHLLYCLKRILKRPHYSSLLLQGDKWVNKRKILGWGEAGREKRIPLAISKKRPISTVRFKEFVP